MGGEKKRGFKMFVGGGLGAVPHRAKVLDEFLPVEELLPISQAMAKVFSRLGERKNRNKARLKFVVAKLGIEGFRRLVWKNANSCVMTRRGRPTWATWMRMKRHH